jgi:hypothetical protein
MANPTVKETYSLDVQTVRVLERVARRWGVSKSEALRRAIRASESIAADPQMPLAALDELQAVAEVSAAAAAAWNREVRVSDVPIAPRSAAGDSARHQLPIHALVAGFDSPSRREAGPPARRVTWSISTGSSRSKKQTGREI